MAAPATWALLPANGAATVPRMTDPDESDDLDQNAQLDREDTLEDRGVADPLDEGYSPPERPYATEDWGTTAREQEDGEPIEGRLDRELPEVGEDDDRVTDEDSQDIAVARDVDDDTGESLGDAADTDGELVDDEVGEERSGRLAATGGTFVNDEELFAQDEGYAGGAASAEEAAVHTVPDGD